MLGVFTVLYREEFGWLTVDVVMFLQRFCFVLFDNRSAVDRLLEKGTIAVDGKTLVVQKKMKTNANAYPRMYRNSNR